MLTLHVVHARGGWTVKFQLDDVPSVLIETKIEALKVAQRIAAKHEDVTILFYDRDGQAPNKVEVRTPRTKLLHRPISQRLKQTKSA
jgi:hypothetical protein